MTQPDGNDFHYKVKKVLTDLGWTVRMSPYYNDSFSEKPREIDIIAEKAFLPIENSILHISTVIVRLFIECKYVADQTTFWFEERNIEKAKGVVNASRSFHETKQNHLVTTSHHYLSDNLIAKLYKTDGKNQDGDPVFKAIHQCLNATIYYRDNRTDLYAKYSHMSVEEINYPVIIYNSFDKFIKKDTTSEPPTTTSVVERFQLEVDYAYVAKGKPEEELFYLDVLSIDMIKDFEDTVLLKEINLAKQKMSDDKRESDFHKMRSGRDDNNFFDSYQ